MGKGKGKTHEWVKLSLHIWYGDVLGSMFYFGDVFGSAFDFGDVLGSAFFIGDVYGLHKIDS